MEAAQSSNFGTSTDNTEAMRDQAHGKISQFASAAHQTVDKVVAAANTAQQRLSAASNEYGEQVRVYVTNQPLKSIGIALAVGLLIGRLMR